MADTIKQVPKLRNKCYEDFTLDDEEWELLKLIHEVLTV